MPRGYKKNGEKLIPPSPKGRIVTLDHRKNLSKALMGKVGTYGHLGKKHSISSKKKISDSRKGKAMGDRNASWKGGITPLYNQIRNCFQYRQWVSDIFSMQNFICQDCGKRGGDLEAHHIDKFSDIIKRNNIKNLQDALLCGELWNLNNGRTLCVDCHKKTKR